MIALVTEHQRHIRRRRRIARSLFTTYLMVSLCGCATTGVGVAASAPATSAPETGANAPLTVILEPGTLRPRPNELGLGVTTDRGVYIDVLGHPWDIDIVRSYLTSEQHSSRSEIALALIVNFTALDLTLGDLAAFIAEIQDAGNAVGVTKPIILSVRVNRYVASVADSWAWAAKSKDGARSR
jgi:hypothetical protein